MDDSLRTPLVKSITPLSVRAGESEVEVMLEGERLDGVTDVLFLGAGISVRSIRPLGQYRIAARVAVSRFATAGYRYLMLVDPEAGIGVARQQLYVET
jgi:hypothetical protein